MTKLNQPLTFPNINPNPQRATSNTNDMNMNELQLIFESLSEKAKVKMAF